MLFRVQRRQLILSIASNKVNTSSCLHRVQTGQNHFFFRLALDALAAEDPIYFPISLNFEIYEGCTPSEFYQGFCEDIREEIETVFSRGRGEGTSRNSVLTQFLEEPTDNQPPRTQ